MALQGGIGTRKTGGGGGGGGGLIGRRQGGGGQMAGPRLPGRGGGGRGRPNQGGHNPGARRDLRQKRRGNEEEEAKEEVTTGIGGSLMNDIDTARQGGMGLIENAAAPIGGAAGNPFAASQNTFMNNEMNNLYSQYQGYQTANPGLEDFTWSQWLQQQYGAQPGQGMLNYMRNKWARSSNLQRGVDDRGYYGAGRTITG